LRGGDAAADRELNVLRPRFCPTMAASLSAAATSSMLPERAAAAAALEGDDLLLLRGEAAAAAGASSSSASSSLPFGPAAACAARCSISSLRFAAAARDALIAFCLRLSRSAAAGLLISAARALTAHGPPSKFQTTAKFSGGRGRRMGWGDRLLPVGDPGSALAQGQSAIVSVNAGQVRSVRSVSQRLSV
jgi:hypothetical protein